MEECQRVVVSGIISYYMWHWLSCRHFLEDCLGIVNVRYTIIVEFFFGGGVVDWLQKQLLVHFYFAVHLIELGLSTTVLCEDDR